MQRLTRRVSVVRMRIDGIQYSENIIDEAIYHNLSQSLCIKLETNLSYA